MAIPIVRFPKGGAKAPPRALRRIRAAMKKDGAVVLEGLFPEPLLRKLRGYVLRRHARGELHAHGLVRDIGGRYAAVLPFEGPFLDERFYANGRLLDAVAAVLGSDHCIGSLEAVVSVPGAYRQHVHIDGPIRFDQASGRGRLHYPGDLSDLPPYAVTLCVPLCDIDEDNGPTAIWRGSHRAALRPRPPSDAQIRRDFPVERMVGPLGRAFMFDFRTFHCGLPNYTREPRPLLMFVFTRRWFRDPNMAEVYPSVVIGKRALAGVPARLQSLFMLAPGARRALWSK